MDRARYVLEKIESQAEHANIPFIGPDKGAVLAKVVEDARPEKILEIGTNIGYSSILMAEAANGKTEITTIEIEPDIADRARENIKEAGFSDVIDVIIGDAKTAIPLLDGAFDLLFLDAVKHEYANYLQLAEPKLSKGAKVFADNVGVFASSMQDYLQKVRDNKMYNSKTVEVGNDAVEITKKLV